MKISVGTLSPDDGQEWKNLYRGYAEFHYDPMNNEILTLSGIRLLMKTKHSMIW